jgi:hypothetical protein
MMSTAAAAGAKDKTVSGNWTFTVEHLPMPLTLAQKKKTVDGSLSWPHGAPIKLSGRYDGRTLTLSGNSSGDNFTIHVDLTGAITAGGTLDGSLKAHFVDFNDAHEVVRQMDQEMLWTAQRTEMPSLGTSVHSAR